MQTDSDKLNCIKNLVRMMCCDKKLQQEELQFLAKAAKQLNMEIKDWKGLLREVQTDNCPLYPIVDKDKAIATLQALVVMAKIDKDLALEERKFIQQYAKSINVDNNQWKQIISDINVDKLFAVFNESRGEIVAVKNDFEKIEAFCMMATKNNVHVDTTDLKTILKDKSICEGKTICFHAGEKKEDSILRYKSLVENTYGTFVGIFTRFQGNQVQYLRELGLKKCIIEPVYAQDIINIFKP